MGIITAPDSRLSQCLLLKGGKVIEATFIPVVESNFSAFFQAYCLQPGLVFLHSLHNVNINSLTDHLRRKSRLALVSCKVWIVMSQDMLLS